LEQHFRSFSRQFHLFTPETETHISVNVCKKKNLYLMSTYSFIHIVNEYTEPLEHYGRNNYISLLLLAKPLLEVFPAKLCIRSPLPLNTSCLNPQM